MNNQTVLLKVKERLNKLDSNDYKNLQAWQIVEAFNKAQLDWCRRNLHGTNILHEGDEQSISRIDDFEKLITSPKSLSFIDKGIYYESTVGSWPDNYLRYKRIDLMVINDCCSEPKLMNTYLGEAANVNIYLKDENMKPNYAWGETFAIISNDKINIYHDNQFLIKEASLVYYKKPLPIQIIGVVDLQTKLDSTIEVICEFRDDIAEVLVAECASILAGDIENQLQMERESRDVENNN